MVGCGSYTDLTDDGLELPKYVAFDLHGEIDDQEEEKKGEVNNNNKDVVAKELEPLQIPKEVLMREVYIFKAYKLQDSDEHS